MYEMYMYTDGERSDALEKANLLDPSKEHFGDRVISRDDGAQKHQEGLDIVLGHDNAAVILANTENVSDFFPCDCHLTEKYFDSVIEGCVL